MNKRTAVVDFNKCKPEECAPEDGKCAAAAACKRGIMQQEAPFEAPMVFPEDMCMACSDCKLACPLGAVSVIRK